MKCNRCSVSHANSVVKKKNGQSPSGIQVTCPVYHEDDSGGKRIVRM